MNKRNGKRGFTMAELLIVVAIIGVLAAVSFVAVAQHQRSLERVERDSVAREIFVAAQNHLTMAEGQGFLGLGDERGETEDADAGIYFFVVNGNLNDPPQNLADLMLPVGAIDETVRTGGSYIIRYHRDTATVMDVFYCSTDSRFGHTLSQGEEADLVANWREGKESARRNYTGGSVLGWYGGAEAETLPHSTVEEPTIEIENAEKLRILVKDSDTGSPDLQIIVTGATSGAKKVFTLKSTGAVTSDDRIQSDASYDFAIVLDDITTAGMHFADIIADTGAFIPGEDITVQAVAFDNSSISNIAYSAEKTTNSLYEKIELGAASEGKGGITASIGNIRHLENLDRDISNMKGIDVGKDADKVSYALQSAVQTSDMSWTDFKAATGRDATAIHPFDADADPTDAGCYMPVNPGLALSYDGQGHSISEIKVAHAGNAGLFGTLTGTGSATEPTTLQNLALIDFDITQKAGDAIDGNAGALAGTLANVKVINVVAYDQGAQSQITANSGNAGGLVGSATGCDIEKSAASVYVTSAAGDAGGLAGTTDGGSVTGCYSGGHTNGSGAYDSTRYNVTATTGSAGGLIASATSTTVAQSYSTCSVTGVTAGGFVATASTAITDCYATGLVKGTGTDSVSGADIPRDGAFAYSLPTSGNSNCLYFEIINERHARNADGSDADGYESLTALGKKGSVAGVTAIDADAASYDDFVGDPDDWKGASAYDAGLIAYYGGKYTLKTVEQLGATLADSDFVSIHRGDWPAPETFVIDTTSAPAGFSGGD